MSVEQNSDSIETLSKTDVPTQAIKVDPSYFLYPQPSPPEELPKLVIDAYADMRALEAYIHRRRHDLCTNYFADAKTTLDSGVSLGSPAQEILGVLQLYFDSLENA